MKIERPIVNVSLYPRLGYDVRRDFTPVILVGTSANVLVVHPSLPAQSVKALVALAKSKPVQLTYASAGTASSNHLSRRKAWKWSAARRPNSRVSSTTKSPSMRSS